MIKGSVGRGGLNKKKDVEIVQKLLNNYVNGQYTIYFGTLVEDGKCKAKTIDAIKVFQSHVVGMGVPDCRIDVGGGSILKLQQYKENNSVTLTSLITPIFSTFVFSQKSAKDNTTIKNKSLLKKPNVSASANSKTDPRKLKTREAIAQVYGAITSDKKWADRNKYLKAFIIPSDIASHEDYNWVVPFDPRKRKVSKIWCNISMHSFLLKALNNLKNRNLLSELKEFGGSHNIRATRGTTKWSAHSWALAIDLNMSENGLGKTPKLSAEFVKCFTDAGFGWGGYYNRKDGMHFTIAGYDLPKKNQSK
ncbi:hypothetical protein MNBD_GAMMA08-2846 [hydrothermal vent metagenome]|uniref:Peptidase M15C domain-containing protein n=1 Tax=hydrothermal vent metagenome TaxID=652676 RepID=A0A3B0XMK5_9ZZZZ